MHKLPYNNQAGGAMKILNKLLGAALGLAVLAAPVAQATTDNTLIYNFSNLGAYSGTVPDSSTDTYARATITWNNNSTTATIMMEVIPGVLADSSIYVNDWYFNLDPLNLATSLNYSSGVMAKSLFYTSPNTYNADGGGYFDIRISFNTSNPGELGQDTSIPNNVSTYTLTTKDVLNATSFSYNSVHPKGGTTEDPRGIKSAVHVQGYFSSVWLMQTCSPDDLTCAPCVQGDTRPICSPPPQCLPGDNNPECVTNNPEPATLAILGTGLFGMAVVRRRRKSRKV